ncbi:GNAT family N-acetyltransferase [Halobacterium rubrum]|uniref:GNAT family N-acetyltransferase n=1 Tax=Halobacterium TaxID=2239 RepID=UPI001EFFB86D|nr:MULTISPECIES: GNAT family N-acetyltransferase [Halobacterium]MDH5019948.1 GNAT family N-acetyltransferase [Halobacterium rubrum]
MRVVRVESDDHRYEDALSVRYAVFVDEQGVPEELEVDEHEASATHFVGYADDDEAVGDGENRGRGGEGGDGGAGGEPVAAARLREYEPGVGKVERVAVREEHRGEGLGAAVMDAVEAYAAREGFDELYLHAQLHVEAFYAARGYERDGEPFTEAGIEHVAMRLAL